MPDIVYEDDSIIIANKSQGVPVEPDASGGLSLLEMVWKRGGEAYACHRLDNMTGGLVIMAKSETAMRYIQDVMRRDTEEGLIGRTKHRSITKIYLCQTICKPHSPQGELRAFLKKDPQAAKVTAYAAPKPGARLARTMYKLVRVNDDNTALIAARLLTGRTHQIRAQFAAAGWPILGDDKYCSWAVNRQYKAKKQRLWAVELSFNNVSGPLAGVNGKSFWVDAPFAKGVAMEEIGRF